MKKRICIAFMAGLIIGGVIVGLMCYAKSGQCKDAEQTPCFRLPVLEDGEVDVAISPCGKLAICRYSEDHAGVYDLTTGDKLRDFEAWFISDFRFAENLEYIYNVEYQDAHSGWVDVIYVNDPSRDIYIEFEGRLCPIDNQGRFLVDMENDCVLELFSGRRIDLKVDHYFEFSPDSELLALETSGNGLIVYDTMTWTPVFEESFINHSGTIFLNNEDYMLVCYYLTPDYDGPQMAKVYDTVTWELVNTLQLDSWIEDLQHVYGTYVLDPVTNRLVNLVPEL